MSAGKTSFAPRNSVIFIADPTHLYEVPINIGSALATSSGSCVAVGTLAEMDGDTLVSLGTIAAVGSDTLVFEGCIETPKKQIAVIDVPGKVRLKLTVKRNVTNIKIWANDLSEPDRIVIQAF